jgi:hypothetical protein
LIFGFSFVTQLSVCSYEEAINNVFLVHGMALGEIQFSVSLYLKYSSESDSFTISQCLITGSFNLPVSILIKHSDKVLSTKNITGCW